jgi:hypothetical protein
LPALISTNGKTATEDDALGSAAIVTAFAVDDVEPVTFRRSRKNSSADR